MSNTKPGCSRIDGRFLFFQEYLKHPLQIASIIPSSRFLERRILEVAGISSVKTIVELGSGTGGTTRAILRALPQDASLLSIEINPHFNALVSSIEDDRLIAHLGSVQPEGNHFDVWVRLPGGRNFRYSLFHHEPQLRISSYRGDLLFAGPKWTIRGVSDEHAGCHLVPAFLRIRADGGGTSQHPADACLPVEEELRLTRQINTDKNTGMQSQREKKTDEKGAGARLLEAATALFAEKGYASTYVREVVTRDGVTKPVLYYYFKNKGGLFCSILDSAVELQKTILGEVLETSSLSQRNWQG